MIFHSRVSGLGGEVNDIVNRSFAPFFPLFGYVTKYLIYKPAVLFYRFLGLEVEERHRGLMHSVLGLLAATFLTTAYMLVIMLFLGLNFLVLPVFMAGYVFGFLMHLLEDSMTVSGIDWLYPFSETSLKGRIRTASEGKNTRGPAYFSYFLLVVFGVAYSIETGLRPLVAAVASAAVMLVSGLFLASTQDLA